MTRRREGRVKRGENNLAINLSPKCSPQPGTPREITSALKLGKVVIQGWGME